MLNEELKNHVDTIAEVSVLKERNRIARDVHDTLGHTFTAIISLLEVCRHKLANDEDDLPDTLDKASCAAREGLQEIRHSISGLLPKHTESNGIIYSLDLLFKELEQQNLIINFITDGTPKPITPGYKGTIYRICQEAATNSIRHGKATELNVFLYFREEVIKLFIIDNGKGCTRIMPGTGLRGMCQRVKELAGNIHFGINGEEGFNIKAEFPLLK